MLQDKLKEKKGFTIIEVVIVLAIAALIITIVLLAVAALQRSQRTKAQQEYAGRVLSQLQQWESDNGGNTTLAVSGTIPNSYLNNANPPGTSSATNATGGAPGAVTGAPTVVVYGPGGCSGGATANTASATTFGVSYWSETSGAAVCIHN